ncbi:MAG: hypothetical protein KAQ87_02905 [Candidatus Pacebacteria bacterium]|nr:hypothetical protein [Candidatus Paceibacterota bacterium]
MITSLSKRQIESVDWIIRKRVISNGGKLKIAFGGGTSKEIEKIESLEVKNKSILINKISYYIKYIIDIFADDKRIVSFTRKGEVVIFT